MRLNKRKYNFKNLSIDYFKTQGDETYDFCCGIVGCYQLRLRNYRFCSYHSKKVDMSKVFAI